MGVLIILDFLLSGSVHLTPLLADGTYFWFRFSQGFSDQCTVTSLQCKLKCTKWGQSKDLLPSSLLVNVNINPTRGAVRARKQLLWEVTKLKPKTPNMVLSEKLSIPFSYLFISSRHSSSLRSHKTTLCLFQIQISILFLYFLCWQGGCNHETCFFCSPIIATLHCPVFLYPTVLFSESKRRTDLQVNDWHLPSVSAELWQNEVLPCACGMEMLE